MCDCKIVPPVGGTSGTVDQCGQNPVILLVLGGELPIVYQHRECTCDLLAETREPVALMVVDRKYASDSVPSLSHSRAALWHQLLTDHRPAKADRRRLPLGRSMPLP